MASQSKIVAMLQSKDEKPADFSKCLDLWYADGSIILVADKTGFRVHTSILATHCEIFRDMVAIPQPTNKDDSDSYEGCPVLRLQDSSTDMYHFLKAIYDFSYFRPGVKTTFAVAAAVLRLSTKYFAPALRRQAVEMLTTAYPSDFNAWKCRGVDRLVLPVDNELSAVVLLAEQSDVRALLPSVFYAASKRPLAEILPQLQSLPLNEATRNDISSKFLLGRERLRQEEIKEVLAFLQPTFVRQSCQNNNDITTLLNAARTALLHLADVEPYYDFCINNPGDVGPSLGLCVNCTNTVKQHVEDAVRKIWDKLPSIFGLPDWEILTAEESTHELAGAE